MSSILDNVASTLQSLEGVKVPTSLRNFSVDTLLGNQPRGLSNFIYEIRDCKNKQEEKIRIDQELGNIRGKFATTSNLTSYQKKKYVWKMCYIHMLGYDVDFGHVEFISLMASQKYTEKAVGYLAISLMLTPGDDLMTLVVNSIRNDITGQLDYGQSLGLCAVSNIGGSDLAESLASDVQHLLFHPGEYIQHAKNNPNIEPELVHRMKSSVIKKSAMCLVRLFRSNPDIVEFNSSLVHNMSNLLQNKEIGIVTASMSLLLALASHTPSAFETLIPDILGLLKKLVLNRTCSHDYNYYRIPAPWLQVKLLRFLQYYKVPQDSYWDDLNHILAKILHKSDHTDHTSNKINAENSILFEAINLILIYGTDCPESLKGHTTSILGKFISAKDANTRYLGLESMTRLAKIDGPESVQAHQEKVINSLKDADYSVKKKALNLLFVMADSSNAQEIVAELVVVLSTAESAIKEDIVVKSAILSEKYCDGNWTWYIDTMIQVILVAGDFVSEAVWYRIVQIVTNAPDIHEYAAEKLLSTAQSKYTHEILVAVAGYLLGEIGYTISDNAGMSGLDQFLALDQHFVHVDAITKGILLTTYVKLLNQYPEQVKPAVDEVFIRHSTSIDLELQQRACEYLALPHLQGDLMESALHTMPAYETGDTDALLSQAEKTTADRSQWSLDPSERAGADSEKVDLENASAKAYNAVLAATSQSSSNTGNRVDNLLSLDDDDDALTPAVELGHEEPTSKAAGGQVLDIPASLAREVESNYKAACRCRGIAVRSVLFAGQEGVGGDNEHPLAVSIAADFRAHQGRLALFLKASKPITNLAVNVPEVDYLAIQVQAVSSTSLAMEEEIKIGIVANCVQPFTSSPIVEVSYTSNGKQYRYVMKLPVTAVSFFDPLPCDKSFYMSRWKSIDGPETESQQIFEADCSRTVDVTLVKELRSSLATEAMHLGFAEGLDKENTITGCSSFVTGNSIVIGVLMRLEADFANQKYRITVRSKHPTIAKALTSFVIDQLS